MRSDSPGENGALEDGLCGMVPTKVPVVHKHHLQIFMGSPTWQCYPHLLPAARGDLATLKPGESEQRAKVHLVKNEWSNSLSWKAHEHKI